MRKSHYRSYCMVVFLFLAGLCIGGLASASPARPDLQPFTQPSGQTFQARLQGDENLNWAVTTQDEIIVKDEDKYWNYAELNNGNLESSGEKYGVDPRPTEVVNSEELNEFFEENPEVLESSNAARSGGLLENSGPAAPANGGLFENIAGQETKGTQKILVLLVEFTNINFIYSDSQWNNRFFDTSSRSVRDYYREVSHGQLDFVPATETKGTANDGIVRVQLNHPHETGGNIAKEAIIAADPYINIASYDTDGDGYIQNDELRIVTILAGYETSYSSAYTPTVWGHFSGLGSSDAPTIDGKKVFDSNHGGNYTQQGERHGDHMATIGILVHELGHSLGVPDLYDTDSSSSGIGIHSVMSYGSWGALSGEYAGTTPVHFDAWSKTMLEYVTPTLAKTNTSTAYTLKSISTNAYNVVKIPTSDPKQYFLLENRQYEGYDRSLNMHGGIAIWHIDQNQSGNYDDLRRLVDLEEVSEYNPYFYSGNATDFTPNTVPNSNRYTGYYIDQYTGINVNVPQTSSNSMTVNVYGDYTATAPTSLSSTYSTMSTVGLTWNATTDTDFDHYVIYRNGNLYTTTTKTSYKDAWLNGSTTYTYTVRMIDKAGNESVDSNAVTVTTAATDSVIIYYKQGFSTPYVKYKIYYSDPWMDLALVPSEFPGYSKAVIPKGIELSSIAAYFHDGNGNVDDNSGRLYSFAPGVSTFVSGLITEDYPDTQSPSVPTGLVSTDKSDTQVSLKWSAASDNLGVTGYEVYRDNVKIGTTSSLSYTATGLTGSTAYSFTVKAYDAAGNLSGASAPLLITTNPSHIVTIYYKPGFNAPNIHYRPAGGTWTAVPGLPMAVSEVPGYYKFSINIGTASQLEACFNNGSGTWDNNNGSNYIFQLGVWTFYNGTITSGAPTPDTQAPTVPTGLASTAKTDSSVSLAWTASTDNVAVTGYDIYRDGTKIGTSTGTSYTATGLSANTSYSFTVKAYDAAGNISAASVALSVTTNPITGNTVTVYYKKGFSTPYIHYRPAGGTWTTVPGVAIPASEATGYNKITINIGSATQLEACFNNGSGTWDNNNGANYFFGVGTWTFNAGTIVSGAPDSQAPSTPAGLASTAKTDTSVSLTWTASTDNVAVTGYEIYRNGTKIGTSTSTSYTATGLSANTAYSFTVKAYDAAGNVSAASSALSVTTNPWTGNTVTIYYKKGFNTPYIHYRQANNTWTSEPGVAMSASEVSGYNKITINIGSLTQLEACFNDGNGNWDSQYGANYFFGVGTWTFNAGSITAGTP
ncbi:carbohydrate binding domain-containing protein [Cohnella faecalis]|uniref:M6 family metalloprotease domain-containing protein n=1 Tax=Cohnella faecalis TaxID=2315694 RepID=A0A398CHG9_9BACL|nr:carbohydrate binding domain-containing protein [Cohnella faecalis]RIE01432.1 M6 family metalloprotease domain-containing protein [Cohnella faecalis]